SPSILARALSEVPRSDVLHLHAPLVPAVPLSWVAATLRVPIVVTYHCDLRVPSRAGPRLVETVARASQDFALDRAQRIVTNTEDYARHTAALADRIEKVEWILPPVPSSSAPADVRRRFGVAGSPVVFFLGRFAEEKGLLVLLDAFAEIRRRHPAAALVLAGAKDLPGESVLARLEPALADPRS